MADVSPARGTEPRRRAGDIGTRLGRIVPFASGGLVVLVAVLLYGALVPGPPPLTQRDVEDTVAGALASVTPGPAYSEVVYQAVRPSLVLIETTGPGDDGRPGRDGGLGSGVVVNVDGDILTSLHVVEDAVNPGNSGGPLLNRDGHVIGIVTALINPTDDEVFIGIGLAVPIDVAGGAAGLPPY